GYLRGGREGVQKAPQGMIAPGRDLTRRDPREALVAYEAADDRAVLLLDPGLVILVVSPRARELPALLLAVGQECLVDEGTVVVRVDPLDRDGELAAEHLQGLHYQGLLTRHQGDCLGPARADVGRQQAPQEGPLHGTAAVRDEVDLQVARRGIAVVREGAGGDLLARVALGPSLLAAGGVTPRRSQEAVDGGGAGGEDALADGGVE